MTTSTGTVAAIVAKELRIERRAPQLLPAMVLFSVATFVVFHFALQRDTLEGPLAAGVLTATLLFAAMLGIGRLFVLDREEGGLDGIVLAPVEATQLLAAKLIVLVLYLVLVELIALPAFALLLLGTSLDAGRIGELLLVLLLADAGIAVIGALVGVIAVQTRVRDLLVPLLGLPLLLPVVIGVAQLLAAVFATGPAPGLPGRWLVIVALYDGIFGLLAYALFDALIED